MKKAAVTILSVIAIVVAVVVILAWDALRNSYVRFLGMVTGNGAKDGPEE